MFFSVMNKNSNWKILIKNLVTLENKMGLIRMKNCNISGVH